MIAAIEHIVRSASNVHRPDGRPNVFLFSTPRSGSTWLMELICTQPGFKYCNEPLNLRNPHFARYSRFDGWRHLYNDDSLPVVEKYFRSICEGRLRFTNPNPFRRYYRPLTHRIVFKEIHGGADRINWFGDTFNGRIVYLVRHPIAVTLSRKRFQTLDALLDSDYARHFTSEQLDYARNVARDGTELERGVLAWCLQNAVPLRQATDDWAIVSYEQLVLDPDPVIDYLADRLDLPKPDRIRNRLLVASGVKRKSKVETQEFLSRRDTQKRGWLVEKWRRELSEAQERRVMEILDRFDLDVYRFGEILPTPALWVQPSGADRGSVSLRAART